MTDSIADLLIAGVTKHLKRLQIYHVNFLVTDMARRNDKRPAYLKIAVLDDVVKNLGGDERLLDEYILVRIPAEVRDTEIAEELDRMEKEAAEIDAEVEACLGPADNTGAVLDEAVELSEAP